MSSGKCECGRSYRVTRLARLFLSEGGPGVEPLELDLRFGEVEGEAALLLSAVGSDQVVACLVASEWDAAGLWPLSCRDDFCSWIVRRSRARVSDPVFMVAMRRVVQLVRRKLVDAGLLSSAGVVH